MSESPGLLSAFLARGAATREDNVTLASGNTPTAVALAAELRETLTKAVQRAPRSVQVHLGPSELGEPCHRQVVGKLAGLPATNHVTDPWPSWVGTACHAAAADMLEAAQPQRWFTERRVVPIEGHSGTADLYDAKLRAVVDHKFLGTTTYTKVRSKGPGRRYYIQLLLYGLGYRNAGIPVDRVMLVAWPRTGSSVDGVYVYDHELTPEDDDLLAFVIGTELPYRKQLAELLKAGRIGLRDVPITEHPDCYFCPFYRPEARHDSNAAGCPGAVDTVTAWA